jgi:hypothetical protein
MSYGLEKMYADYQQVPAGLREVFRRKHAENAELHGRVAELEAERKQEQKHRAARVELYGRLDHPANDAARRRRLDDRLRKLGIAGNAVERQQRLIAKLDATRQIPRF